jgi:hypothetical protein
LQPSTSIRVTGGSLDGTVIGGLNPMPARFSAATVTQLVPVLPEQLTSKQYVDTTVGNLVNSIVAGDITPAILAGYLKLNGGTMTGPLILSGDPTQALGAATKEYVDTAAGGATVDAFAAKLATQNDPTKGAGLVGYRNETVYTALDSLIVQPQNAHTFYGGPVSGAAAAPAFRALTVADLSFAGQANGVATLGADGYIPLSQINPALIGGLIYQGTWNASTNTPTLTSGVGTKGWFYKVTVAGSTPLDGITQWNLGDIAAFNGTTWDKIDGVSTEVISVAGRTGAVVLTYLDIGGLAPVAHSGSFTDLQNIPTATTSTLGLMSVGDNLTVDANGRVSAAASQLLPATTSTLGGVIIGDGIDVDSNGVISVAGGQVGSVKSVALALPSIFIVTGSPVTTTGTLTGQLASQNANCVWAGPTLGSADIPSFRKLVAKDMPIATAALVGGVSVSAGLSITVGGALSANLTTVAGRIGDVVLGVADVAGAAPLASPALTGFPTAPTQAASDNSTNIATTAYVQAALVAYNLPVATNSALGGVIIGSGLTVTGGGNLSVTPANHLGGYGGVSIPLGANVGLLCDDNGSVTNSGVLRFNTRTGNVVLTLGDITGANGAPIASPAFTGTPTAPTPATADNSQTLATTAFVYNVVAAGAVTSFNGRGGAITLTLADISGAGGAPIASPTFTGSPAAPTVAISDNSTTLATTAFVHNLVEASGVSAFNTRTGNVTLLAADITGAGGALLASPNLTGTPTAPTQTASDSSTAIATTAFVHSVFSGSTVTSFNGRTGAVALTLADVTGVGGAPLASPTFSGTPTTPDINLILAYSGTQIVNMNMLTAVTGGVGSLAVTGNTANDTLKASQYLCPTIVISDGGVSAGATAHFPANGSWTIVNQVTSFPLTLSNGGTASVFAPPGETIQVYANGAAGMFYAYTAGLTPVTTDNSQKLATTAYVQNVMATLGVASFNGRTGAVVFQAADITGVGGALLASPAFTGVPTTTTAAVGNNSTQIASTAYIQNTLLNAATLTLSNANVTLTNAQYGAQIIRLNGTLTNSVTLTVPTSGQWTVYNNTTGAFNVTFSNGSGATYVAPQNESAYILSIGSLGIINGNVAGNVITPATQSTIGGVIIPNGSGLAVDTSGNISIAAASAGGLGGVKQGAGVTIAGDGTLSANVVTVAGRTGAVVLAVADVSGAAPLASPALTGTPTAPTATAGTNNTQIATTAFVAAAVLGAAVTSFNTRTGAVTLTTADITNAGGAPIASPTFTGNPAAPTQTLNDTATTLANLAYVYNATQGYAGVSVQDLTGAGTLSLTAAQYSSKVVSISGALKGSQLVRFPATGHWIVLSTVTAQGALGYTISIDNGSGTPINIPQYPGSGPALIYEMIGTPAGMQIITSPSQAVTSVAGRTGAIVLAVADVSGAAPLASPSFTGVPVAPTASAGTSTTQLATTAFVATSYAPLASPTLTGTPVAPTATAGTNNTQIATAAYVYNATQGEASVALTNANVTLTAAQYSVPIIKFTGTLTGNVQITVPTTGEWTFYNACTMGAFTITLTNGSGGTVVISATGQTLVISDSVGGVLSVGSGGAGGVASFNTRTGAVTLQASDVTGVGGLVNTGRSTIPAETFAVNQLGSVSGSVTMDQSLYGEFTLTVTGNTTINLTNPPTGGQVTIIRMTNGGSAAITWPSNTKFANATAPVYTVSGIDVFVVLYDVVSSTYMVFVAGQAMG